MRTVSQYLIDLWQQGGPFIGSDRSHGRVTVEPAWTLHLDATAVTEQPSQLPYRWFQRLDNSQVEVEVPNVTKIDWDRSQKADAATCTITVANVQTSVASVQAGSSGVAGYYTWAHGQPDAQARWGQTPNSWWEVLVPNALLRTYEGYGGYNVDGTPMSIASAVAGGYLYLTGLWLIDDVRVGTDGIMTITCRDMAKLLIEQLVFPPFSPGPAWYPIAFKRWVYAQHIAPAVPVYDFTDPIESGQGPEGPKYVTDIALSADGLGYWVVGTDGGVFTFGRTSFFGSRGTEADPAPMTSIVADPLNHGYWICNADGDVYTFGQVLYYGGSPVGAEGTIVAMVAHPNGRGYWLVGDDGKVYEFGDAAHFGDEPNTSGRPIVDMAATATGLGYWLLADDGAIFTFGDAPFHGSASVGLDLATGMAIHASGWGYHIVTIAGNVYAFGNAEIESANGDWAATQPILNDPIFSITSMPTGNGYLLVGGDGGVFSFGDAPFWGSLPGDFRWEEKLDGNYRDLADVVSALLMWSGWLAYDGDGGEANVYGNIETTGTYLEEDIPVDTFDRRSPIDGINAMREIVNYGFWIDEEGAAHWESMNFYTYGNFLDTGEHVETLVEIDERYVLSDYAVSYADQGQVRSELVISSHDPTVGLDDVVTTRLKLGPGVYGTDLVRGMVRPYLWFNEHWASATQQETLANRIADLIIFSLRRGTVRCVANPRVQINDQVRIYERITAETFVHWVEGIKSTHDIQSGEWLYDITTSWLGEDWIEEQQR